MLSKEQQIRKLLLAADGVTALILSASIIKRWVDRTKPLSASHIDVAILLWTVADMSENYRRLSELKAH